MDMVRSKCHHLWVTMPGREVFRTGFFFVVFFVFFTEVEWRERGVLWLLKGQNWQ